MARCFLVISMALDQNEKKLIEKLTIALNLLSAGKEDIEVISGAEKIDDTFLENARSIFDNTEACSVCSHAFHSWRKTLDDETVLSFIDDWINWKSQNSNSDSKATER